jgi:hypothetical protein
MGEASDDMDFLSRIKKEMTEGMVRAVLTDAGYRVIGLGVEAAVREVDCLNAMEYASLDMPKAMRSMPDFLVMNRAQTFKWLVELKYRARWDVSIFSDIAEQVRLFGEMVLVYVNANPPAAKGREGPSANMRCCRVRCIEGQLEAYLKCNDAMRWVEPADLGDHDGQWWALVPIQNVFEQVKNKRDDKTLMKAVRSLQGILGA